MKMLMILTMLTLSSFTLAKTEPVQTVSQVDLNRYLGEWYELASIPQSFQKVCVKNVKAQYSLTSNGLIKVVNTCETKNGDIKIANARARVTDKKSNAKLNVTFVKIFNWVFALGGKYWILDLDQDYTYAVVGDPTRQYGWILSRTKEVSPAVWERAKAVLAKNGYDLCQFQTTIQDDFTEERSSLCL